MKKFKNIIFLGRTLSCVNSTLVRQDPTETQRTVELRVWFDNEGKSMDLPDLSKGADIGNRQSCFFFFLFIQIFIIIISAAMKTFSQIASEGLGLGDKPDYVSVKAISTLIKKDAAVYMVKILNISKEKKELKFCLNNRCVQKINAVKKLSMKIMVHIDVKNVIKLIIILNGHIWFRYVYSINLCYFKS
jgi:hypothetical protein